MNVMFAASVIIPAFNAATTLGCQLRALADQEDAPPFEVIVADNGSTDDTRAVAETYRGILDIRVIDASARRGPAAARNIGTHFANAPLILFCDADDRVDRGWVRGLADALQHYRLATGPVIPAGPSPIVDVTQDMQPESRGLTRRFMNLVPIAGAGHLGIRREYFEALSGFDEGMICSEDVDICVRAYIGGTRLGWAPEAVLYRSERVKLRQMARQRFNWGYYDVIAYKKYRDILGLRMDAVGMLRPYVALAARSYRLATRQRRWWIQSIAYRAGRLTGSIRARVVCP